MRNLRRVLALALTVGITLTMGACGKKDAQSANENSNVLRVGMECGYAPYNWTQLDDSNGAVKIEGTNEFAGGYDVEIAKRVAQDLGKELLVVKTDWDGLPPAVQSGKIDLIMAGMSPTPERQKQIAFTSPYWESEYVMIVKKGSAFENAKSIQDFSGAKISAQLNTVHYDLIDQINGVNKQEAQGTFPELRIALQSGVIDGYVAEVPEAKSVEAATDDLVAVYFNDGEGFTFDEGTNQVAACLSLENKELLEAVNTSIEKISQDERLEIMDSAIANQPANN